MQPIVTPSIHELGSLSISQKYIPNPSQLGEQLKENNFKVGKSGKGLSTELGKKSRPYVYQNLIAEQNQKTGGNYSVEKETAANNLKAVAGTVEAMIGTQIDLLA